MNDIYFFGCRNESKGHYLFGPNLKSVRGGEEKELSNSFGFPWFHLDTKFLPKTYKQGAVKLTHINGWTIISFPDNSVDKRPNSHSTYAIKGTFSLEEGLEMCKKSFEEVFSRYEFEISEYKKATV